MEYFEVVAEVVFEQLGIIATGNSLVFSESTKAPCNTLN